jgi:hypothetical protein|tara:strand:- start:541 stop:789 length:249 start_codon:yes stop_codon:yes gene_type:complete
MKKYHYSVVPFVANISHESGAHAVAKQLAQQLDSARMEGWEYVRLETVETYRSGVSGCFGGWKDGMEPRVEHFSVIIFRKEI